MFDKETTTIVLNALYDEWVNFVSSIYGKKEATPFNELWSLCKIEETRLKAKSDVRSSEKLKHVQLWLERKGRLGRLFLRKKISLTCQRSNAMSVMNMGTLRAIVLNSRRTTRK